jgi:Flp pilus assembly protein TadG
VELVPGIKGRADRSGRAGPGSGQRAQAIIEFAFVLPVLLFLLFAVLEGALALFTVDSARYAAGEAARQESESGTNSNADSAAVQVILTGPLGTTSLATISHVDVYHLNQQGNGTYVEDGAQYNSYRSPWPPVAGSTINSTYPPAGRNVRSGQSDFLRLKIFYQYNWLSGRMLGSGPLQLVQTFDVRLEPQAY